MPDGAKDPILDYYRTQEELDGVQLLNTEAVGYVNARMRLVGQMLDKNTVIDTEESENNESGS